MGTETVSAASDLAVGTHGGTSPALSFAWPGNYYLYARLNDSNAFPETDSTNNVTRSAAAVAVSGQGSVILDNGQPGYSERGTWFDGSTAGAYNGGYRYANPAAGSTAIWTVAAGLPAGNYQVQVTWPGDSGYRSHLVHPGYDGA